MGFRVFWLTLIRILLIIISAATLGCHISQITLLGNKDWFPSNYLYILYFVGPGVSLISSLALLSTMICGIKSIRGDRFVGVFNLALMIATVVIGTVKSGSGGPTAGFNSNCTSELDLTDLKRCWLSNGMWIGGIVVAAFWLLLVLYVYVQRSGNIFNDDEYEIYDFKATTVVESPPSIVSPLKQQNDQVTSHNDHKDYHQQAYYDRVGGSTNYGQQQHPSASYSYAQPPNYRNQPPHQYDAYGGGGEGGSNTYNNNNGSYGYYVPESTLTTPLEPTHSLHYTNSTSYDPHANDDTAHIMADIGSVDRRPHQSPPHTPSKSHQVPHAYD